MDYRPVSEKTSRGFRKTEIILFCIYAVGFLITILFLHGMFDLSYVVYFLNYLFGIPFTIFDSILLIKGASKDQRHIASAAVVILINILLYVGLVVIFTSGAFLYDAVWVVIINAAFFLRYAISLGICFLFDKEQKRAAIPEDQRKKTFLEKIPSPFFIYAIAFGLIVFLTFLYFSLAHVGASFMGNIKDASDIVKIVFFVIFFLIDIAALFFLLAVYSVKKKNFKHPWKAVTITLVSEILFCSFTILATIDGAFAFYPTRYVSSAVPSEAKQVHINVDGKTYTGLYVDNEKENVNLVFLGNGQSSLSYGEIKDVSLYSEQNILFVDYPMFGQSDGPLTEANIYQEADGFYDYLINKGYPSSNIQISGFSIGTGVACYLASHHEARKLVLAAPYDSFVSVMNDYVNVFYPPLSFFADFKFPSYEYAKDITCPTAIYYSEYDQLVRVKHTKALIKSFAKVTPEVNALSSHTSHNGVYQSEEFQVELFGLTLEEYKAKMVSQTPHTNQ